MAVIYAIDNEFAASTGSNIDATDHYSFFDHPPNSLTDLVITSRQSDTDPYLFEVGEIYSLSWGGQYGGGIMENATIVRSDPLAQDGQGVVVFEGTTEAGDAVQIVWSPNFDLEAWYWGNFESGQTSAFYTYDTVEETYGYVCFTAGTRIRTPSGLRAVEKLRPGDLVLTRDNGVRPILWIGRKSVEGWGSTAPVRFEAEAFGNAAPITLSQQHRLLVSGPPALLLFGEEEVLVPAKALINGVSIRMRPCQQVTYFHILLENHEVLDAEGMAAESLFLGDVAQRAVLGASEDPFPAMIPGLSKTAMTARAARQLLTVREGEALADFLGQPPVHRNPRPPSPVLAV